MHSVASNYVLLLIIAMTYLLRHVWAGTPLKHVQARTPSSPPGNQTLSRHDVICQHLTKNTDVIYPSAWLGNPPLEHVCARTPQLVNQTLSKHDVIWQRTVTI